MCNIASETNLFQMARASELFPVNTPHSKEAFYMRKIFNQHFPSENAAKTVFKWIPKWQVDILISKWTVIHLIFKAY